MSEPGIARWRRVLEALAHGNAPDQADIAWLVQAGTRYEAGKGTLALDAALGLGRPGARGWWTVEAISARNAALADLWHRHFAHLSHGEAARQIAALARHQVHGKARALLEPVLRTGQPIPGPKQLTAILRKSASLAHFHEVISTAGP